jgi:hypothetical protein
MGDIDNCRAERTLSERQRDEVAVEAQFFRILSSLAKVADKHCNSSTHNLRKARTPQTN